MAEHQLHLVIRNPSEESIIIDQIAVRPNVVGLAEGHDMRSTMEAVKNRQDVVREAVRDCFVVLKPLEERALNLIIFEAFGKLKDNERVTIRLGWRNTRSPFPFKRSVRVKTTALDIRKFRER
jgi:hypothetical protein